ncbi:DUF3911 family protein [Ectobacillus funiculus]|uniref:DUF3911 family protein n=1 Tax=Ectobacillus funiculus TaxID=137993 RepID=UPI00397C74E9
MTILQIKGTKQEIQKILDLFNFIEKTNLFPPEHCVELRLQRDNGTHKADILVVSSNIELNDHEANEADSFVIKMLTGVYND